MKLKFTKQFGLALVCMLVSAAAMAQLRNPLDIATDHIRNHHAEWGLTEDDITGMKVTDQYTDPTTGISRVFFQQRHVGVPVFNAIQNVNITPDGRVFFVGKRFIGHLAEKVNTLEPVLDAETAVLQLMSHLQLPYAPLKSLGQDENGDYIFDKGIVAKQDIKARLSLQPYGSAVQLAWDIELVPTNSSDMWSARVDAVTGALLDRINWTVYCQVDGRSFAHVHNDCEAEHHEVAKAATASFNMAADGTYNIWPSPVESPIHGSRQVVVDPHDLAASPYGWHDTNGQPGPEFTITRGNNVHAYEDSGNTDSSVGNEPDGGASLVFDFPYDALQEPVAYTDAAITNLFYWNNLMHDLSYSYGMTEVAGAFQTNNYGNGGIGGDEVHAEGQDGGGTNNANFGTPPDGGNGRMQMYLWDNNAGGEVFTVNEPASVAGGYPSAQPGSGWGNGAYATSTGVTGEVVIVEDNFANPLYTDACDSLTNAPALAGKVALIDRQGCEFGFKARHAQYNGAIAVIICNFEDGTISMGAGAAGAQVNIPTVMMGSVDCQTIRQFAGNGLNVTIKLPDGPGGPGQLDGDLDNGIIAHEYGHGISNRLTGGPSQAGCLGNAEQMGEGWSDWFSLITSVMPDDLGTDARGIGTYALGEDTDGLGIRRFPYSTDMSICPLTYGDVASSNGVHDIGEVWVTMVWDLYWAMTDEYGWDADLYHGTGGNNMAIRLVYEGMKIQACSPGFLDGRDAILAADEALYNGANQCLIWKVFGRRGAGLSAVQGSSDSFTDQVEAFDIPCECRDELTMIKTVTDFIQPGEEILVSFSLANCKLETRTNIVISDNIPAGTTFKAGSASVPATVSGNVLTLQVPDLAFNQSATITYKLSTSPDNYSVRYFLDDVPTEDAEDNWSYYVLQDSPNPNAFQIQDVVSNSPDYAWNAPNLDVESRTALELVVPWTVTGTRPTYRFYHRYDTQSGVDGGFVEVKKENEIPWSKVDDKILRNGYTGALAYGEAFVVANLQAFSGNSGGEFVDTYVDLSSWAGENVVVRHLFGTNGDTGGQLGWTLDDFEFMDLLAYNEEACVTTAQGDNVCDIAPSEGTIVDSRFPTSSTTETLADMSMTVFPNPAADMVSVALSSELKREAVLSLVSVDGRTMVQREVNLFGNDQFSLNVSTLPAGVYFVKLATAEGVMIQKLIVE